MNHLKPKNSVNVNIAIHMPNPQKMLKSAALTIDKTNFDGEEDDMEHLRRTSNFSLDDVVEISSAARKLAENRRK